MHELKIEDRRIIPIRAIPEVTCHEISVFSIAWILAERIPDYHPIASLDSYHVGQDGAYHKMFPREWDVVIYDLERLENELGLKGEKWLWYHPVFREKSIATLLQGTFAWWDEFETAHSTLWPEDLIPPFDDREGYLKINEAPHLDPRISELIYEGFDSLLSTEIHEQASSASIEIVKPNNHFRDLEIGHIAQRMRNDNSNISERGIADQIYYLRRRKGPKPERLRQIIRDFKKK